MGLKKTTTTGQEHDMRGCQNQDWKVKVMWVAAGSTCTGICHRNTLINACLTTVTWRPGQTLGYLEQHIQNEIRYYSDPFPKPHNEKDQGYQILLLSFFAEAAKKETPRLGFLLCLLLITSHYWNYSMPRLGALCKNTNESLDVGLQTPPVAISYFHLPLRYKLTFMADNKCDIISI